jgi:hypothetical protein
VAVGSFVLAGIVAATAVLGLLITHLFQVRQSLGALLKRHEVERFGVLMWRMEQLTRSAERPFSADPKYVNELRSAHLPDTPKRQLLESALGSDWGTPRAYLHEVHYFALQVQTWRRAFPAVPVFSKCRRTRLLNDLFGPRLLATFLDHRLVALRLRRNEQEDPGYFATQYGLFEPGYKELVESLANDLLHPQPKRWWLPRLIWKQLDKKRRGRKPSGPISKALSMRRETIKKTLAPMSPVDPLLVARAEALDAAQPG